MPYEHRFGRTSKRNDCRHDPAYAGIFIHGGCCNSGPFKHNNRPNSFGITLPTRNKHDQEINLSHIPLERNLPTFEKALAYAKRLQLHQPLLQACSIYACTDMLMDTTYSGHVGVQLVSPAVLIGPLMERIQRTRERRAWRADFRQAQAAARIRRPFYAELARELNINLEEIPA